MNQTLTRYEGPESLIDALVPELLSFITNELEGFAARNIDQLSELNVMIADFRKGLSVIGESDSDIPELWAVLETFLNGVSKWSDYRWYSDFRKDMINAAGVRMSTLISELPVYETIPWDDGFFSEVTTLSFRATMFVLIKRLGLWSEKKIVSGVNRILPGRLKLKKPQHGLRTRDYSALYFQEPAINAVAYAADCMLNFGSEFIGTLHNQIKEVLSTIILNDTIKNGRLFRECNELKTLMDNIGVGIMTEEQFKTNLDGLRSELNETLQTKTSTIRNQFIQNSRFTGTWAYPHYRYGRRQLKRIRARRERINQRFQSLWERHYEGELYDWNHDVILNILQVKSFLAATEAVNTISENIVEKIIPICSEAVDILNKALQRLDKLHDQKDRDLRVAMIRESRTMLKTFRREMVPAIAARFLGTGIGQDIKHVIHRVNESVENLEETHTVFKHRGEGIPPRSELDTIPIQDLLIEEVVVTVYRALENYETDLRVRIDETINAISDIRQSIEFNIETSMNLLENQEQADEALTMVTEGIQRSSEQLLVLKTTVERFPEDLCDTFGVIIGKWLIYIEKLIDTDQLLSLKLSLSRARTKGRLNRIARAAKQNCYASVRKIYSLLVTSYGKMRETVIRVRSYLGFALPDDGVQIQFAQFLLETQEKINSLPYVYQQLFQIEPLTDDRLFSGREQELDMLTGDVKQWKTSGGNMITAIVGEKGSGKSTLINMFEQKVSKSVPVTTLRFTETVHSVTEIVEAFAPFFKETTLETFEQLEAGLTERENPVILVFENIHHLFIKSMDGFDHLELFLDLMFRTREKIFWLCTCAFYCWEYLDKAVRISQAFSRVIVLRPFTGEQIESMILARHRITGYKLRFKTPKHIAQSRSYKKKQSDEERQAFLKALFFDQIQKVAAGNISVAILFWLRSIEEIRQHELQLASQVEFNLNYLSAQTPEELFTLGALAQHEILSAEDHAHIFRQSLRNSVLILNTLSRSGIIQQENHYYKIHPFLYRHVIRSLKLQNIIH